MALAPTGSSLALGAFARRQSAHRHPPLTPVDGSDLVDLAKAYQWATVVGIFTQQSLEEQLVDEITPAAGSKFSTNALGRQRRF